MKLSDIGFLSRGKSKHRPRNDQILYGGKYPFIQTSDIKKANHILYTYEQTYNEIGLKQSKLWGKNTICITIAANIADSAILGFEACFPDSIIGLEVNDKIANYHYIEYLLQYYKIILQNQSNGTSQENINLETFEQVYFDIPSLEQQNAISHILYTIDKKIELNDKLNNELEKLAQTLYNYWFVQFDFPDEFGRPYKSSGGKMVYNEVLKREIPASWEVKKFNEYATIGSGFSFCSKDYIKNGAWKIITIKNVQDGNLNLSDVATIADIPDSIPDFVKLEIGDVLISLTGNVGRMCLVCSDNCLLNQRVGKLLTDYRFLLFAYLFLSSPANRVRMEQISNGSSQQNLSPIQAVDFPFAVPDKKVLERFNQIIAPTYKRMMLNNIQSEYLKNIRDFLHPMLMNGQVTINS